MRAALALALMLALGVASAGRADVVLLINGDRISGRIQASTPRRVRLQTLYGTLAIPRQHVQRLEYDDGRVEVVNAPREPPPPVPTPRPEPARLQLAVTGDSFWQAWDPRAAPADPSLRLELLLDDAPIVSYTDSKLDPEDLPGAVVNSFVFSPEDLLVRVGPGVVVAPPIVVDAEIGLALEIPPEASGPHSLRLAYQINEGTAAEPTWLNVVTATLPVEVAPGRTLALRLEQSRGSMEYAHRRMLHVETFSALLEHDGSASPAVSSP